MFPYLTLTSLFSFLRPKGDLVTYQVKKHVAFFPVGGCTSVAVARSMWEGKPSQLLWFTVSQLSSKYKIYCCCSSRTTHLCVIIRNSLWSKVSVSDGNTSLYNCVISGIEVHVLSLFVFNIKIPSFTLVRFLRESSSFLCFPSVCEL